jgi:hypothetical protein
LTFTASLLAKPAFKRHIEKYKEIRRKWLTKGHALSNIAPSNDVPIPQ